MLVYVDATCVHDMKVGHDSRFTKIRDRLVLFNPGKLAALGHQIVFA